MKKTLDYNSISNLFEVSDKITIENKPKSWSSAAGGRCPVANIKVDFPYTSEIVKIVNVIDECDHIAILDNNNFGWSLTSLVENNNIDLNKFIRYKKLKKLNERRR